MSSIVVDHLERKFGGAVAVDKISFIVEPGEIFGFLGPNGAGKTTTINMLCTLLKLTSGRAIVNNYDVVECQSDVRKSIGIIFQDASLDDKLTGLENLQFHNMLYGLSHSDFQQKSLDLVRIVDLEDRVHEVVQNYSGGMKRRLEIARGLLHDPKILFLDEPTLGLDPQTRRHIWQYLITLRDNRGVTMFMTTHYMEEAEHCDRIAIIDNGQIVGLDTPANLKSMLGGDIITVDTSDNKLSFNKMKGLTDVQTRYGPNNDLIIETKRGDQFIPEMLSLLSGSDNSNIEVKSVSLRQPTLEDVFIKLTGHAIRDYDSGNKDKVRSGMRRWRGR